MDDDNSETINRNQLEVNAKIDELLLLLEEYKPGDRGELDRIYAVAITDVQKLWAWWQFAHFGLPKIERVQP